MTLKFENAKIYFIQSVASPNLPIYINSTTAVRLCSSISQLKQRFNKNKLLKSEDDLKKIFESKKFKYCLIKNFPCKDADELNLELLNIKNEFIQQTINKTEKKQHQYHNRNIKIVEPCNDAEFIVNF